VTAQPTNLQPGGSPARLQVTVAEAARMLSYGKRTLYRLIQSGELPSIGSGRLLRIAVTDLEAYQERHRKGGD
jgi:excisionase family DNA binding protein